jgi:FkbM family methyltransferase
MSIRGSVQNMFLRLGWDVRRASYPSSEELLLKQFLAVARPDAVFDVGANIGQYGLSLRKCGFTGRIVSFEAVASVHARLSAVAARDRDWLVAPCCALGRAPGETRINVSANSVSSSILPMRDAHLQAAPDSAYVANETIRLAKLDDIAGPLLPKDGRLLLKIDTQGYEEEVLSGADLVLESVSAMQLELSVAPLYQGAPDLRRMLELCERLGFHLHGLIPGFYEEKTGRLLQMDGLFLRAPAAQTSATRRVAIPRN